MPKLVVASVLYDAEPDHVMRFVRAVVLGLDVARARGGIDSVHLLLGDCGSARLTTGVLDALLADSPVEASYREFGGNLGHSAGCNALVEEAGPLAPDDLLVFLNPDALPEASALGQLASVVGRRGVGVADARQIPFEHPKKFDFTTGAQSWASGACLGVRAGVFASVGGFDSEYFWSYCNDVDLSWRVRLKGLEAMHVPQAVVFHDKRIDGRGDVIATSSQDYYSTLGRLFLADRYARPELGRRTIAWAVSHGSESHKKAVAEYRARKSQGATPLPVPGAATVATFVGGEYAPHRF